MILKDGMILYHGSYTEIDNIDLNMCDEAKDFGRGFYLTASEKQAAAFIPTSLTKAKRRGRVPNDQMFGYVTAFRVHINAEIRCYEFITTDKNWLYYIAVNRRHQLAGKLKRFLSDDFDAYEILTGKIANDDTNITLNAFLAGTYGDVESDLSYEIVTKLLKPDRLENQFCFKSERSIQLLEKIGAEKYEIRPT